MRVVEVPNSMCLCTYLELNAVFLTPSSRLESKSRHITPVQRLIKLAEWQLYWPWLRNSSDHPPQCVCRMKVDGLANGLRRRRNYHYHLLDPMLMRLKVASCPPSLSAMAVLVAELPESNSKKGPQLLRQKVCQRISVMKTNNGVFVVFKTKHESKCQFSEKTLLYYWDSLMNFLT